MVNRIVSDIYSDTWNNLTANKTIILYSNIWNPLSEYKQIINTLHNTSCNKFGTI